MVSYFFRGLDTWKQPHCNASGIMGIGLGRIGGIFPMIPMADFFSLVNYFHHITITCYKNLLRLLYVCTIFQVRPDTSWFITSARYWPDISSPTSRRREAPSAAAKFFIGGPEWGKDFADNQAVGQGVSHGGMVSSHDWHGGNMVIYRFDLPGRKLVMWIPELCWICVRYIMNLTI
jgi:hypothetical protein